MEKRIKARTACKHDTESNWNNATSFVPMKGEIIVYDKDNNYSYERFKIGDGSTIVVNLPFASYGSKDATKKYVDDKVSDLSSTLSSDIGNKVDKVSGKGLSTNDYTTAEKNNVASNTSARHTHSNKTVLDGITAEKVSQWDSGQSNIIETIKVNGTAQTPSNKAVNIAVPTKTSQLSNDSGFITSSDIPEGSAASTTTPKMNGTASVGTEMAFARGDHVHPSDTTKVDKVDGKGLSTNDFTDTYKTKLDGIETGANKTVVDSALSSTSTNPVQNKAIYTALSVKADIDLDNVFGGINTFMGDCKFDGDVAVNNPVNDNNPTTKKYVDDLVSTKTENIKTGTGTNSLYMNNTSSLTEPDDGGDLHTAETTSEAPQANGTGSFAIGIGTKAEGDVSVAEGIKTTAGYLRDDGTRNVGSHAEGVGTFAKSSASHAEGYYTQSLASNSHTEGFFNKVEADALSGHAEGRENTVTGVAGHAEGYSNTVSGANAHAENESNTASGKDSHAEGYGTKATRDFAHAEGYKTTASALYGHSEGARSTASAAAAHSEGADTTASGECAHAEGKLNTASGKYSHVGGYGNTSANFAGTVIGQYAKVSEKSSKEYDSTGEAFVIGNGTADDARSNAFEVLFDGTVKANDKQLATQKYVDDATANEHTHSNKTVLDGITAEKVSQWDNSASAASAPFIVTVSSSGSVLSADKTYAEIVQAIKSGKNVLVYMAKSYFPVITYNADLIVFGIIEVTVTSHYVDPCAVAIYRDNSVDTISNDVYYAFDYYNPCLIEGTPIDMADGTTKAIEEVQTGDLLQSYNPETGEITPAVVISSYVTGYSRKFNVYSFEDGHHLTVYGMHGFYNKRTGETKDIRDISKNDILVTLSGEETKLITSRELLFHGEKKRRYNLVTSNNLYFANGILLGQKPFSKMQFVLDNKVSLPDEIRAAWQADVDEYNSYSAFLNDPAYHAEIASAYASLSKAEHHIKVNKQRLANSDYWVQKFTEGLLSISEWADAKTKRAAWRKEVNDNEALRDESKATVDAIIAKYRGGKTPKSVFESCCTRDNALFDTVKAYFAGGEDE